jgi:hypothetical protein
MSSPPPDQAINGVCRRLPTSLSGGSRAYAADAASLTGAVVIDRRLGVIRPRIRRVRAACAALPPPDRAHADRGEDSIKEMKARHR